MKKHKNIFPFSIIHIMPEVYFHPYISVQPLIYSRYYNCHREYPHNWLARIKRHQVDLE